MKQYHGDPRKSELAKAAAMAGILSACAWITYYSHFVLGTEVVFTHLFYIPIILGGVWWGRKAVWVAFSLGAILVISRRFSALPDSYFTDLLRAGMFLVISFVVGILWEKYGASERKLRETRVFLDSLIGSSTSPILVWDVKGRITFFNEALEQLTGFLGPKMLGQPVRELFDEETLGGLAGALGGRLAEPVEAAITLSDGRNAICLWSASAVRNGDGRVVGFMLQGQDITKRKWAEKILQRHAEELEILNRRLADSEKSLRELNAAKDKFFSIISHDLRSPFMPLLLYSELLAKEAGAYNREKIAESAKAIHDNAHRIFGYVENLLEWSRIQTGRIDYKPSMIDMRDVTQRAFSILKENADNKKILLRCDVSENCRAWADRYHINCVMQNLVSNGIKFTPPGGEVRVTARPEEKMLRVNVSDTGVGMGEEAVSSVFRIDTYHTTVGTAREKGSGLGLILCKDLLEKNGGDIQVESQPGRGSTFSFTLPFDPPAAMTS